MKFALQLIAVEEPDKKKKKNNSRILVQSIPIDVYDDNSSSETTEVIKNLLVDIEGKLYGAFPQIRNDLSQFGLDRQKSADVHSDFLYELYQRLVNDPKTCIQSIKKSEQDSEFTIIIKGNTV